MIAAIIIVGLVCFLLGYVWASLRSPRELTTGKESKYRNALIKIGSGSSGNPELEAQLALEEER
jgi:hypothetical protein